MSKAMTNESHDPMVFEKLNVSREVQVLFAEISAPPMNLQGSALIRDLVSLIQRAEAYAAVRTCEDNRMPRHSRIERSTHVDHSF